MFIYFLLIIYILIVNILIGHSTNKRKMISIFLSCLGIFLVQALRKDTVGIDLYSYRFVYFNDISSIGFIDLWQYAQKSNIEFGYVLFNKLISLIYNNWQFFLIVITFIVNLILGIFIYKNSCVPLISFMLYIGMGVFLFSFSGLRQILAISFTMLAYCALKDKKYLRWIIWIIIAFFFHKSALIFVLSFVMYYIKIKPKHIPLIVFIMIFIMIFAFDIMQIIVNLIFPRYAQYIVSTNSFGLMGIFLAFCYFYCFKNSYKIDDNKEINLLRNLVLVGALIQLFGNVSTVTLRMTYYFLPYFTLLIPYSSKMIKDEILSTSINTLYCIFVLGFIFISALINSALNITPYQFFWQ